jgi:small conductance mechanosensitive channel
MQEAFNNALTLLADASVPVRILVFLVLAGLAHFLVRQLRNWAEAALRPRRGAPVTLITRYPKVVTILTLAVSAITVAVYFSAFGLILREFGISLRAYFASASIIGLAVAFGSQGLVQDVVTGITLIFSDAIDVGDMVDFNTQPGRVIKVGLRFTVLSTALGRELIVPNRNIAQITRFPVGGTFAYLDVQIPTSVDAAQAEARLLTLVDSFRTQHRSVLTSAKSMGIKDAGDWQFVRLELRALPGQQPLVDGPLQQRVVAALQELEPKAAAWMVTVTHRNASMTPSNSNLVTAEPPPVSGPPDKIL